MNTERVAAVIADRYRIERRLGEGGMATVYLAFDLKHDRRVALKVLKPELAAVLGAERFIHEIKTTANLQHPHILPLFDSGKAGGRDVGHAEEFLYYVMPFIEGETLRQKLTRETQLGIDESVRITREVADALDYAHRHGVIHRDIKPENILLQDGRALVADFGIALAVSAAAGGRMTETGLSLGTPHYMSPEQATAEKELTPRSDVYSLGSVLYEMLAGEPPHTGGSAQAVIMKIVTDRARPVSELRRSVPPNVAAAVEKSLEKLAADRFESAKAFSEALANPGFTVTGTAANRVIYSKSDHWKRIAIVAGVIAAATTAIAASVLFRPTVRQSDGPTVVATLELPRDAAIDYQWISFSQDGSRLFTSARQNGTRSVWTRRLDDTGWHPVPGTVDGTYAFDTPDGQWVVFRKGATGYGLVRVPIAGGPEESLDPPAGSLSIGAWGADGTLYYSRSYTSGLWELKPGASQPVMLTAPDSTRTELGHWSPQVLPDGKHILFTAFTTPLDRARIEVFDLESHARTVIVEGGIAPTYIQGFLIFVRGGSLFAAKFDPRRLELEGEPVPVLNDVAVKQIEGLGGYAISPSGTLAFISSAEYDATSDLVLVDRSGKESPAVAQAAMYDTPSLSPDGHRTAVSITAPGETADIWVVDLRSGGRTRITSGDGTDFAPVWTPDGRTLVYVSERPIFDLYTRPADASSPARPFLTSRFDKFPGSFSQDGRELVFEHAFNPFNEIWRGSTGGADTARVLAGQGSMRDPVLSPNGKWLAAKTSESGRDEIIVVSYPDASLGRKIVSVEGGGEPRWTRGGRELVWRLGTGIYSATFDPATGDAGTPTLLFRGDYLASATNAGRGWDVTADGQRFLFMKRPAERAPRRVTIITNWVASLRDKVKK